MPFLTAEKTIYTLSFAYYPLLFFRVVPRLLVRNGTDHKQQAAFIHLFEHYAILLFHVFSVAYMIYYFDVSWHFLFGEDVSINVGARYLAKHANIDSFIFGTMVFYSISLLVLWLYPRKNDAFVMSIHHLATVFLMQQAYITSFVDITVWVLFVNSLADIFLEASKIALRHNTLYKLKMDAAFFAVFIGIHLVLRCIVYPYKIFTCACASYDHMHTISHFFSVFSNIPLFILNIFWLGKTVKTCHRRLTTGLREVDDSEPPNEDLKSE